MSIDYKTIFDSHKNLKNLMKVNTVCIHSMDLWWIKPYFHSKFHKQKSIIFFFDSLLLCNLFIIGFNKKRKVFSWNRFVFLIFELVHLQMAFCWDSHINIVCATESWDQTKFRCPLWVMNNNNRLVSCRSFFFNSIFA